MNRPKNVLLLIVGLVSSGLLSFGATPPDAVNYQGVLRDASDKPLDGDHDMVFRFWSAESDGDEILVDQHLAANNQAVTASSGLFSVQLGTGQVLDGSGPGTYTSLAQVFADYGDVWLEVQVGSETLSPRVRVVSAGYALNAGRLEGRPAGAFVDTSAAAQTKSGRLVIDTAGQGTYGLEGYGDVAGGYFRDADNSGYAEVGVGNRGIQAFGDAMGGYFKDADQSAYANVAFANRGIEAFGTTMGGYFADSDGSGYVQAGINHDGIRAYGNTTGGYFEDTNGSGIARVAFGDRGIQASGTQMGADFQDSDSSGYAWVAYGDRGIQAGGTEAGGYFEDTNQSGYAYVGYGENGISAYGNTAGGFFQDLNGSGWAYVGSGDYGVRGVGNTGAYFRTPNYSAEAWLGYDSAEVAPTTGVYGKGDFQGGYFEGFDNTERDYSWAGVGRGSTGVIADGTQKGAEFYSRTGGIWTLISTKNGNTIQGNGQKNFVQNHPYDPSLEIVYTALEGNETGTYTRGRGRLRDGRAVIALDESFAWVTNPDIGLTAHLTARSPGADLYVESLTSEELIVRANEGSTPDAAFDYIVYGLRIGFEEIPVVRPKEDGRNSPIPSMATQRKLLAERPELRATTPLERFRTMTEAAEGIDAAAIDLSRARALVAAIHEFDPAVDSVGSPPRGPIRGERRSVADDRSTTSPTTARVGHASRSTTPEPSATIAQAEPTPESEPLPPGATAMIVSGPVAPGDLLVLDPEHPGLLRVADTAIDPGVVGVAAAASRQNEDGALQAPVLAAGIVELKVDAGYGAIRPGDLLVSSATPAHAMQALEALPGTVIGKALEALETGTGTIRVLLLAR